jgi:hypothetical protein
VSARIEALADRLSGYDRLVEIGIGRRPDLASTLVERDCTVLATDVHERPVPEGVRFVRDDVTDPDPAVYADADAIYALNLPPELHRPALAVAREADADLAFTTLGGDPPLIPVDRESLPDDTLFWSRRG